MIAKKIAKYTFAYTALQYSKFTALMLSNKITRINKFSHRPSLEIIATIKSNKQTKYLRIVHSIHLKFCPRLLIKEAINFSQQI